MAIDFRTSGGRYAWSEGDVEDILPLPEWRETKNPPSEYPRVDRLRVSFRGPGVSLRTEVFAIYDSGYMTQGQIHRELFRQVEARIAAIRAKVEEVA